MFFLPASRFSNAFLGSLDAQRRAHDTQPPLTNISSKALSGAATHARRKAREAPATDTLQPAPQEAIPGLPDHLVVTHILRSEYFDDPADLARLPAVSRAMRDLVAATGFRFKELDADHAVILGCLSAVRRLQRGGKLSRQEDLCEAAARGGHLEELKLLCAEGWPLDSHTCRAAHTVGQRMTEISRCCSICAPTAAPWDVYTCQYAAMEGHLEVLQWVRANGCPWDERTCGWAAWGGHLELLQWARANGCPWDRGTLFFARDRGHLEVINWAIANGCPE